MTPAAGRWWIRSCEATQVGSELRLSLAGPGWFWIDQSSGGFRVQQYVYFAANAAMTGAVDIAYDPSVRLASIWFTPTEPSQVRVEPIGKVNARAETFWAGLFDAITLGMVVSSEARSAVSVQGAQRFRDRLSAGLTLTYDLDREQADVVLGPLAKGKVPTRPFMDGAPWWVNERQALFANGAQIVGPFPAQRAAVDVVLEQGPGVAVRGVCALDLQRSLDSSSAGIPVQLPRAAVFRSANASLPRQTLPMSTVPCSWYMVLSTVGPMGSVAALRVRPLGGASTSPPPQGAVVKLMLISYKISARNPQGEAWDVADGDPDPVVWLRHGKVRYMLSGKRDDSLEATVSAPAREPLEVTAGQPIVLEVIDSDLVQDDPIGATEISLEDLMQGPELIKTLHLGKALTGEVRIRVDVLTWE